MKQTIQCVRCMKRPAKMWAGHVLRGKQKIIAGWCKRCDYMKPGFRGHWQHLMEAEDAAEDLF